MDKISSKRPKRTWWYPILERFYPDRFGEGELDAIECVVRSVEDEEKIRAELRDMLSDAYDHNDKSVQARYRTIKDLLKGDE